MSMRGSNKLANLERDPVKQWAGQIECRTTITVRGEFLGNPPELVGALVEVPEGDFNYAMRRKGVAWGVVEEPRVDWHGELFRIRATHLDSAKESCRWQRQNDRRLLLQVPNLLIADRLEGLFNFERTERNIFDAALLPDGTVSAARFDP